MSKIRNRAIAKRVSDRYRKLIVDTFIVDTKIIDLILTPDSDVLLKMETNSVYSSVSSADLYTQVTATNYYKKIEVI